MLESVGMNPGASAIVPGRVDDGNSGTAKTIDFIGAAFGSHKITLTAATPTLTLANGVAGCTYTIEVVQDATGLRIPSFSPSLLGAVITFSVGANKRDLVRLYFDGTSYVVLSTVLNIVTG